MSSAVRSSLLCFAASSALLSFAPVAMAQEDSAAASARAGGIEDEIVITAQKREQNLQDVGISVSALSGANLERLNLSDTTSISQQIPGLHLNAWSPNVTIFNLRGISQNNFTDYLEAPVAVYFDNAYMGSINGISGQLFDTRRVEVLRGPQGTLFGRNATGGLIHYVSVGADSETLNGYLSATFGSFNRTELEGAIGGALSDNVRLRVAARYVAADGYMESVDVPGFTTSGQDIGGEDGLALRANLQVDFSDRLTGSFWVKHSEDDDVDTGAYVFANCNFEANGFCETDGAGRGVGRNGVINGLTGAPSSPYANLSDERGFLNREVDIYQADFNYDFGNGVALDSITNYTTLTKDYREDADALPIPLINFGTAADYDQFSQELRLSGGRERFRWQTGLYYLDMQVDGLSRTEGAPAVGAALSLGLPGVSPTLLSNTIVNSQNASVFGQIEYDFTPALTVIAGARYSQDNKDIDFTSSIIEGGTTIVLHTVDEFTAARPGIDEIDYNDWAARLGLNWKVDDNTLLFASWNRGIKGGNWTVSANVTPDDFQHRPEVLNAFEVGVKTDSPANHVRFNATAFYYDYTDYQAFSLLNFAPQVSNSDATAYGAEAELTWSPTEQWYLSLGATAEHSEVDAINGVGEASFGEFFPGAPNSTYCTNVGGSFECDYPIKVIRNAELPNAPSFSLNYVARYNFDALGGNIALQIDGAYYDDQYLEVLNAPASLQEAYGVTNASVSWENEDGLQVELFGKNIFETEYAVYSLDLGALGPTQMYAPPATYGVTLRKHW